MSSSSSGLIGWYCGATKISSVGSLIRLKSSRRSAWLEAWRWMVVKQESRDYIADQRDRQSIKCEISYHLGQVFVRLIGDVCSWDPKLKSTVAIRPFGLSFACGCCRRTVQLTRTSAHRNCVPRPTVVLRAHHNKQRLANIDDDDIGNQVRTLYGTSCQEHQFNEISASHLRPTKAPSTPQPTAKMSHESVWYSRPRTYGKGARSWCVSHR